MIELTDDLVDDLIARARAASPLEVCGLIGVGRGETTPYRAENAAESPRDSFLIAPKEQLALLRKIEEFGQELGGIFHSHPRGPALPSARDRMIARSWPGLTWVIVGLGGETPAVFSGILYNEETPPARHMLRAGGASPRATNERLNQPAGSLPRPQNDGTLPEERPRRVLCSPLSI